MRYVILLKFSHTPEILKIILILHISHCKWQQKLVNSSRKEILVKMIFTPPAFCSASWCGVGDWNDFEIQATFHCIYISLTQLKLFKWISLAAAPMAVPSHHHLRFRSSVSQLLRQSSSERPEWLCLAQKVFLVGISETKNQEPGSKD